MTQTLVPIQQYASAFDLYDFLSQQSVHLSLDDNNDANGQWIGATAQAAINATTINVRCLAYSVKAGATLDFGGENMPSLIEAIVTVDAPAGSTLLTVQPLPGQVNAGAIAIDGGVNAFQLARIQKALNYAAATVNNYILSRYQDEGQLAQSWSVNQWATVIAARWLLKRSSRGCPAGVEADYQETIDELKEVRSGMMQIGDLGTPVAEWPVWSNVTVDPGYWLRKARVQRQISESAGGSPVGYSQSIDYFAEATFEI